MVGYPLSAFKNDLKRVPAHRTKDPALTLDVPGILGSAGSKWVKRHYGDLDDQALVRRLPASIFLRKFTFDQICKIRYSQPIMMEQSVEKLFADNLEFALVSKIQNCMWRWGSGSGVWNEVVDAYSGIRSFSIPASGFEVRLDFTTYHNERGYSRESGVFLDGVFGFLVYYEGEHVMTLGFSIMHGRRVLVQQVQLTRRKGNRFLFKLPSNRVEFFLQCFAAAFPRHTLCMADGGDVGLVSLESYKRGLGHVLRRLSEESSARNLREKEELESKIEHLAADLPRLRSLYAGTGKFTHVGEFKVNNVRHYRLASGAGRRGAAACSKTAARQSVSDLAQTVRAVGCP
jgi:hypothetical protein